MSDQFYDNVTLPLARQIMEQTVNSDRPHFARQARVQVILNNLCTVLLDDIRNRMSTAQIEGKPVLHVFDECVKAAIKDLPERL